MFQDVVGGQMSLEEQPALMWEVVPGVPWISPDILAQYLKSSKSILDLIRWR